jgi:plasmid maintenance system antidote protein VapI
MNAYIVPVGEIILNKLAEDGRTVSWLAKKMGCDRSVVYRMLNKSSIDTARLYQISKIMKVDFFRYYSEALASTG